MMLLMKLCFFIPCFFLPTFGAKVSTEVLAELLRVEQNVVHDLDNTLNLLFNEMEEIDKYISDYWDIRAHGMSPISLVSHPINGYIIMKRLVRTWAAVEEASKNMHNILDDSFNGITAYRKKMGFPEEVDLEVAAQSLIIAQSMYKIDAEDLSNGIIRNTQERETEFTSQWSLSSEDCFFFGENAEEQYNYNLALSYYNIALQKSLQEGNRAQAVEIEESIKNATLKFQNFTAEVEKNREMFPEVIEDDEHYSLKVSRLCSGEHLLAEEIRKTLSCRYLTNNSPYLLLGPMKIEEVSLDPYVVQFHQMMYDSEIDLFKEYASPRLNISLLYTGTAQNARGLTSRTSDNAWMSSRKLSGKITKRIGAATGLYAWKRSQAEGYQIANYGIGGQFSLHHDYLSDHPLFNPSIDGTARGDRVATMMTYLSDVEAGGATIFPRANITVWPKKGSAAFWWNLKRNGEGDVLSEHAGCPVLVGTKWIANKWIRMNAQMFEAKCDLDREKRFDAAFWNASPSM